MVRTDHFTKLEFPSTTLLLHSAVRNVSDVGAFHHSDVCYAEFTFKLLKGWEGFKNLTVIPLLVLQSLDTWFIMMQLELC